MAIFLVLLSYISLAVGQELYHVYGTSNSSINLTSSFDPSNVKDLTWKHDIKGTRYQIAKIKNAILIENYGNRYKQFYNGTVLCINELNDNDSGVYIADVTLHDGTSKEEKMYMTVLDPIPPVGIQGKEQKTIGDRCNVTLLCYVLSNTTDFSYTWKYKQGYSEYQHYGNGRSIQISLPLDHQDTEFICIVSNPADQKNASFPVKHCLEQKRRNRHIVIVFFISMTVVVIVALTVVAAVVCWKRWKRSLFTSRKGKVKDLGEDLDENDERKRLNENEHTVVLMQDSNIQDHEMQIQMKEHKNDEDENEELFMTPPTDASDLDDELRAQIVEGQENEGHEDARNEQEGHETEEHECEGHETEEHECEGHGDERNDHEGHETEEHKCEGHETEEHKCEGHETEEHECEGHETEEHKCEGHETEEHECEGHETEEDENEEYLTTLVEESRDQTEMEEHENNEPENEEHLTIPVEESGEQTESNVNETENEEKLTIPIQETDHIKTLQQYLDKNVEKIEHLHEDENTGDLLQDTSDLDEHDKVEEHKENDDYENEDDLTLVEETGNQKGEL